MVSPTAASPALAPRPDGVPARSQVAFQTAAQTFSVVAAITLAGLLLRLHGLTATQRGIWIDEAFSIWIAAHPVLNMLQIIATIDQHPPLFYLVLHFWDLPSTQQLWVRLMPVVAGALTIPAAYGLGRATGGRKTGFYAAMLVALSPYLVANSQNVRMYALLVLFGTLSLWSLAVLITVPAGKTVAWRWLVHLLSTSALLYTYTEGVFLAAAEGLFVVVWLVIGSGPVPGRRRLLVATSSTVVAGLTWLAWLPAALHQFSGVTQRFWIPPPDSPRVVNTLLTLLNDVDLPTLARGAGAGVFSTAGGWLLAAFFSLAVVGLVWFPGGSPFRWLLLAAFLVPHAGALAVSQVTPVYVDHSLIVSTVGVLMLMAAGLAAITPSVGDLAKRPGQALARLAATIVAGGVLVYLQGQGLAHYYRDSVNEDWAGVASAVAREATPGQTIVFSGSWLQLGFDYYYHGPALAEHGLPVDLFQRGQLEPLMTPADVPHVSDLVHNAPVTLLVYGHEQFDDPQHLVVPALLQVYQSESDQAFAGDIHVIRFSDPRSASPTIALDDHFGSVSVLQGISVERGTSDVMVNLDWRVIGQSPTNLKVFVHILNANGTVRAQDDSEPVHNTLHTSSWPKAASLTDPHHIAAVVGDGPISLEIGLYDPQTGRRVTASGPNAIAGDHVVVAVPGVNNASASAMLPNGLDPRLN